MAVRDPMLTHIKSQDFFSIDDGIPHCFLDRSQDGWCLRVKDGRFFYVNLAFLKFLGESNISNVIGKKINDFVANDDRFLDDVLKTESYVYMRNEKKNITVPSLSFESGIERRSVLITIEPWFGNGNSCIGALWHFENAQPVFLKKKLGLLKNVTYFDKKYKLPEDVFTPREWEVAWLSVHGWKHKDIAAQLNISVGNSRQLLHACYKKLCVHSADEFYQKISFFGWGDSSPQMRASYNKKK